MLRAGFEPTIPAMEWAKTIHVLDHVTTAIGSEDNIESICACESCISWVEVNRRTDLELIWSKRLGSRSVYVNLGCIRDGCDPGVKMMWRENSTHIVNQTPIFRNNNIHNLTVRWLLLGPASSSPFQFQGLPLTFVLQVYIFMLFSASCLLT